MKSCCRLGEVHLTVSEVRRCRGKQKETYSKMKLNILTFNTQHCESFLTGKIDFQCMADVIKSFAPDIVGLNEIRGDGPHDEYTAQTEKLAELAGFDNFFFGKALDLDEGPYGNALLSRFKIEKAEVFPVESVPVHERVGYYEDRALLKAELDCGLNVLIIHFGLSRAEQINAVKAVLPHIAENTVLMGDFNVPPDSDILLPIREKMTDAASVCGNLPSFPSDAPETKIDYIFVSRDIKIISADIPSIIASDHLPHAATVETGSARASDASCRLNQQQSR